MSVLGRVRRRWPLGVVVAAFVMVATVALPVGAGSVSTTVIGYGPELVDGSYLNAQNVANNLVFTSVTIQADSSITVGDDIDLSSTIYGVPAFDLVLIAPTINIDHNLNLSLFGNLQLIANTLNLNGRITAGGSLINPSRIVGPTATHANVLSNAASIQQAIDLTSKTSPVTVQINAGNYEGNLSITKALTLSGNGGSVADGADPSAPQIFGAQAGGRVVTVTANNVTVTGLHLNGAVAGGSLTKSVNGVYGSGVSNLAVSQNTFEGFSGLSIDTPGSSNVMLSANLTLPDVGSVTVGQTGWASDLNCLSNWSVLPNNVAAYVVPQGDWTVTSWSTRSGPRGGTMGLMIFRPASTGSYTLVGASAIESLAVDTANTFALNAPIAVQGGDLLGLYSGPNTACVNTAVGGTNGVINAFGAQPSVGTTITPTFRILSHPPNISATLTPTVGQQVSDLLAQVTAVGPGTSLASKMQQVQAYVAGNDKTNACIALNDFIKQVAAQTGKKLTPTQAASFTAQANAIKTMLGC
jgi:hypothetical protein